MRTVDPVRHEEKRRDILSAARRCLARDGLRAASMSSICAEAGISPGHLYHYFESKDAVIRAITQMVLEEVSSHFSRTMESPDALATLISESMRVLLNDEASRHLLVLDLIADADRNPKMADILQDHSAVMTSLLADFLRKGQAHRQIDPNLDPVATASILIAMIDGTRMMSARHPALDRAKAVEMLRILILRFLTSPPVGEGAVVAPGAEG